MTGPLTGLKVIELAGLGPGPFAAMMLADMGADVIKVDRASSSRGGNPDAPPADVLSRNRQSIGVDLKNPEGVEVLLSLVDGADVLLEGFRPGVCERLGVGPDVCMERNPKLIFGRMTGWGQDGPLADQAGHDINYLALSGTLSMIGRANDRPVPPMNLVADFGGGGMLLAFGVLSALFERSTSGQGQVVDTAMVDGSALLASMMYGLKAMGIWGGGRGGNMLDTGAHFYEVYETADGKYLSVGAIEPQFYALLLDGLGFDESELAPQHDATKWPDNKAVFAERIASKTRAEWEQIFAGTDACVAPVLEPEEALTDPHNQHRNTFVEVSGIAQPAPAPRFSRTPASTPTPPSHLGQDTTEALLRWGLSSDRIEALRESGAIA